MSQICEISLKLFDLTFSGEETSRKCSFCDRLRRDGPGPEQEENDPAGSLQGTHQTR
jgi:hypothetical protein